MDTYSLETNLYKLLGHGKIDLLFNLWETIILGWSMMVISDTPDLCSEMVYGLISSIFPLVYPCYYKPYFTIFDKNFEFLKQSKLK